MAQVTYLGPNESIRHGPDALNKRMFIKNVPTEVPYELALWYEEKSKRGSPWVVDYTYYERFKNRVTK